MIKLIKSDVKYLKYKDFEISFVIKKYKTIFGNFKIKKEIGFHDKTGYLGKVTLDNDKRRYFDVM